VFAANGLGMVMAQKDELGPAREVFQKARESNTTNDDICTNLAHIHLIQDRLTEAEHAYQANLKALIKSNRSIEVGAVNNLCEAMAFAQFKHGRHEDSLRSLLRGIHQEPNMANNGLRNWYNIAVVRLALATSIMSNKKTQKTATSVLNATSELLLAQNLFKFLANQHSTEAFEKDAAKNEFKCSVSFFFFAHFYPLFVFRLRL
jgi:RNA polymerase-associated protein CTR9